MRAAALTASLVLAGFGCDASIDGAGFGPAQSGDPDAGAAASVDAQPVADAAVPVLGRIEIGRAGGSVVVDGNLGEFSGSPIIVLTASETGASATYRLLWDDTALYVAMDASDAVLHADNTGDGDLWRDDGLEILFDTLNDGGANRQSDDYKLFVNLEGAHKSAQASTNSYPAAISFQSAVSLRGTLGDSADTDAGYTLELAIAWSDWGLSPPTAGTTWGFDLKLNDDRGLGGGDHVSSVWNADLGAVNVPDGWGELVFAP